MNLKTNPDAIPSPESNSGAPTPDMSEVRQLAEFIDKAEENGSELRAEYQQFSLHPATFFGNLQALVTMPQEKRLLFLYKLCSQLEVSVEEIRSYFEVFPDDAHLTAEWLGNIDEAAFDGLKRNVLTLCYGILKEKGLLQTEPRSLHPRTNEQILEINERRKRAPALMLEEGTEGFATLASYEKAGGMVGRTLNEAARLMMRGDHMLRTDAMFSEEYEALSPDRKRSLLRKVIAIAHNALLFNEVFNSDFTKESVKTLESIAQKMRSSERPFTATHSMLFDTRQPLSSYQIEQSFFQGQMNTTAFRGGGVEEYPFQRILIAALEKLATENPTEEDIAFLVRFWQKNKNPFFANNVAKNLNTQAESSSLLLLKTIQTEPSSTALQAMLYRIELGKVPLTVEGFKYMEKLYDLGKHNREGNYARRLDIAGNFGVFTPEGNLEQIAQLRNIGDKYSSPEVSMVELSLDLLFETSGDISEEEMEMRLAILKKFKQNYELLFTQKYTSLGLNNIPLKLQAWILQHEKTISSDGAAQFQRYIDTYGAPGAAIAKHLGVAAPQFCESLLKLSKNTGDFVIQKVYGALTSLEQEGSLGRDVEKYHTKYINDVLTILSSSPEDIPRLMTNLKDSLVVLRAVMDRLQEQGKLPTAECSLSIHQDGEHLSVSDIAEMKKIYLSNQEGRITADTLVEMFNERLKRKGQRLYVLRYQGDVVSFISFEEKENGAVYASSFNVTAELRGNAIGALMIEATLNKEAQDHTLEGDCYADLPISSKYIETGWVATAYSMEDNKESQKLDHVLDIRRDDRSNGMYWGKRVTKEAIVTQRAEPASVLIEVATSQSKLPFEKINQGYVITRMFKDEGSGLYYAVFEPAATALPNVTEPLREE